jgi:serine phosphatase RsbU (regulator of sigma subunit)
MWKERKPKFQGLRIYLTSTILYFFLVLPFVSFLVLQNLPNTLKENLASGKIKIEQADKIVASEDSMLTYAMDTLVGVAVPTHEQINERVDSVMAQAEGDLSKLPEDEAHKENNPRLNRFFFLFFRFLVIAYLIGFLFNLPFKLYLKRKRKQKAITKHHEVFCKKLILYTPHINCLILLLPHLVSHVYAITVLSSEAFTEEVERNIFQNFLFVSAVAALLTLLFVYFWQKNRVHLKYLEFFYSEEELRRRIFRSKSGSIGKQLWFASVITTFFPLAIVVLYFVLSLTSVKDLQLKEMTPAQREVLLGNWNDSIDLIWKQNDKQNFEGFYYVNAIDSIVMFVGIGTGIFISLFYLFLIVKWTTRSIVIPVNELLGNIKKIRKDGISDYTIVRTNDEVGELTEGFNVMIHKIKDYIASISEMNKDLEKKVVERTKEIAEQKEEIEAQKEEIETQLEMVINQKNTIEVQQYHILDSIYYAKRIQTALFPPEAVLSNTLSEQFILYHPRDIVSGDFCWHAEKDNKVYVAVADCTGHGVPGAFLSILGISYLNEIVNKTNSLNTSEILGKLRESLISSLHQKGEEGEAQDGMEVALCILDLHKKTLQFSGANRPLYLVRKVNNKREKTEKNDTQRRIINSGDFQMIIYKPDTMPIGIYGDTVQSFTKKDISLLAGDSIYLFTDGYVDQMGGPDRKTFRVKYFRELLFKIQEKSMNEQGNMLAQTIKEWRGDINQTDDILVLGMKI